MSVPHLTFVQFLHILMVDALYKCTVQVILYFQIRYFVVTLSYGDFLASANLVLPIYQRDLLQITYISKRKGTNIDLTVPPFPPSFPWPCVLVLTVRHGLLSIRGGGAWGNKYLGKAAILRQFIPPCLRSDPPEARFNCRRDVHTWDFKTGLLTCWWLRVICTFGRHWLWTISLTVWARSKERL